MEPKNSAEAPIPNRLPASVSWQSLKQRHSELMKVVTVEKNAVISLLGGPDRPRSKEVENVVIQFRSASGEAVHTHAVRPQEMMKMISVAENKILKLLPFDAANRLRVSVTEYRREMVAILTGTERKTEEIAPPAGNGFHAEVPAADYGTEEDAAEPLPEMDEAEDALEPQEEVEVIAPEPSPVPAAVQPQPAPAPVAPALPPPPDLIARLAEDIAEAADAPDEALIRVLGAMVMRRIPAMLEECAAERGGHVSAKEVTALRQCVRQFGIALQKQLRQALRCGPCYAEDAAHVLLEAFGAVRGLPASAWVMDAFELLILEAVDECRASLDADPAAAFAAAGSGKIGIEEDAIRAVLLKDVLATRDALPWTETERVWLETKDFTKYAKGEGKEKLARELNAELFGGVRVRTGEHLSLAAEARRANVWPPQAQRRKADAVVAPPAPAVETAAPAKKEEEKQKPEPVPPEPLAIRVEQATPEPVDPPEKREDESAPALVTPQPVVPQIAQAPAEPVASSVVGDKEEDVPAVSPVPQEPVAIPADPAPAGHAAETPAAPLLAPEPIVLRPEQAPAEPAAPVEVDNAEDASAVSPVPPEPVALRAEQTPSQPTAPAEKQKEEDQPAPSPRAPEPVAAVPEQAQGESLPTPGSLQDAVPAPAIGIIRNDAFYDGYGALVVETVSTEGASFAERRWASSDAGDAAGAAASAEIWLDLPAELPAAAEMSSPARQERPVEAPAAEPWVARLRESVLALVLRHGEQIAAIPDDCNRKKQRIAEIRARHAVLHAAVAEAAEAFRSVNVPTLIARVRTRLVEDAHSVERLRQVGRDLHGLLELWAERDELSALLDGTHDRIRHMRGALRAGKNFADGFRERFLVEPEELLGADAPALGKITAADGAQQAIDEIETEWKALGSSHMHTSALLLSVVECGGEDPKDHLAALLTHAEELTMMPEPSAAPSVPEPEEAPAESAVPVAEMAEIVLPETLVLRYPLRGKTCAVSLDQTQQRLVFIASYNWANRSKYTGGAFSAQDFLRYWPHVYPGVTPPSAEEIAEKLDALSHAYVAKNDVAMQRPPTKEKRAGPKLLTRYRKVLGANGCQAYVCNDNAFAAMAGVPDAIDMAELHERVMRRKRYEQEIYANALTCIRETAERLVAEGKTKYEDIRVAAARIAPGMEFRAGVPVTAQKVGEKLRKRVEQIVTGAPVGAEDDESAA